MSIFVNFVSSLRVEYQHSERHEFVIDSTYKGSWTLLDLLDLILYLDLQSSFSFQSNMRVYLNLQQAFPWMSFNVPVKEIANFVFLTSILYQDSFWVAKQDIFFFKAQDESSLELSM